MCWRVRKTSRHQAVRLVQVELTALRGSDAGRILAPMLQQQQAVIEQLVDRPAPHNPYDSTHGNFLLILLRSIRDMARKAHVQYGSIDASDGGSHTLVCLTASWPYAENMASRHQASWGSGV